MNTQRDRAKFLALIVFAILVIGGGKLLTKTLNTNTTPPVGKSRGDVEFVESDLPEQMAGWSRTRFMPGKTTSELNENEYWWTQSWRYDGAFTPAIVSIDQANWLDWHDLTACYQGTGWKVVSRELHSDDDWPFVVAIFTGPDRNTGMLAFSMFFEDGDPVQPGPFHGTQTRWEHRMSRSALRFDRRAFQCQVFSGITGDQPEIHRDAIIELHLRSRKHLRRVHLLRSATTKSHK